MKKMVFVSGTRADYGKLKSIIRVVECSKEYEAYVYVTGMHLLSQYGCTYRQILDDGYKNIYVEDMLYLTGEMDENIGNTIICFSRYVHKIKPDIIVVHGDRVDALAGALVGVLNNVFVAHIEGGEVTGTIDDSIRHAITKLSHIHFTANEETRLRLLQLGEKDECIEVIGSPDIDIMLSDKLPNLGDVKRKYGILFSEYAIFIYHSVVTEIDVLHEHIKICFDAINSTQYNYIVIYPNNDLGSEMIVNEIEKRKGNNKYCLIKSFQFEAFLTVLKNSRFIIGNSSAGIREACVYGIPCINIGSRQNNRINAKIMKNIVNVSEDFQEILDAICDIEKYHYKSNYFGDGHSAELFLKTMKQKDMIDMNIQKTFVDTEYTKKAINNFINEVCF